MPLPPGAPEGSGSWHGSMSNRHCIRGSTARVAALLPLGEIPHGLANSHDIQQPSQPCSLESALLLVVFCPLGKSLRTLANLEVNEPAYQRVLGKCGQVSLQESLPASVYLSLPCRASVSEVCGMCCRMST